MSNTAQSPWIERVSSKANLSDGVSRDDWALATENGWHRIHIDCSAVFEIICRAAEDTSYAHSAAPSDLASATQGQVMSQLQQCHWFQDITIGDHPLGGPVPRGDLSVPLPRAFDGAFSDLSCWPAQFERALVALFTHR